MLCQEYIGFFRSFPHGGVKESGIRGVPPTARESHLTRPWVSFGLGSFDEEKLHLLPLPEYDGDGGVGPVATLRWERVKPLFPGGKFLP